MEKNNEPKNQNLIVPNVIEQQITSLQKEINNSLEGSFMSVNTSEFLEKQLELIKKFELSIELITPEKAQMYLEKNTHNRPKNKQVVKKYANEISRNSWILTHQAIAFDENGRLQDGQHRLWAIIESDTPVLMLVFRKMSANNFHALDLHRNRKIADMIYVEGFKENYQNLSQIAVFAYFIEKAKVLSAAINRNPPGNYGITTQMISDYIRDNQSLFEETLRVILPIYKDKKEIPIRFLGGMFYLWAKFISLEKAKEFMHLYHFGANMNEGHPILLMRNYMSKQKGKTSELKRDVKVAVLIKTWNNFIQNNLDISLSNIRHNPKTNKYFPDIKNENKETVINLSGKIKDSDLETDEN